MVVSFFAGRRRRVLPLPLSLYFSKVVVLGDI
jgi:hypothetical protein